MYDIELVKEILHPLEPTPGDEMRMSAGDIDSPSFQQDFMLLPITEHRRLMAEQAQQMLSHYEETASERQTWQAGDFVES